MNKEEIQIKVKEIDTIIRKGLWFDMTVLSYDGWKLFVAGSTDLSYYHTLEIIFEDVSFIRGHINFWKSDTTQVVFSMPENEKELNLRYNIEEGHQLFVFKNEDFSNNDIVIAAANLEYYDYSNNPILYYEKEEKEKNS